ncbi:TrmH family RNA methyltransferase [Candidatus Daviesbacteria bacterium]|nr:TrmH family RNA methyltransferase [Candidatus Daviesbacteria bacterium]
MTDKREFVLNAKQLRKGKGERVKGEVRHNEIYIVLDNVLDTYNIGSIFRLADAVAAKKLYLCGGTEIPPNHRIKKASINTTEVVEWEYCESALDVIRKLKIDNGQLKIIAVEQSKKSVPYDQFEYKLPIVLIVGNETTGVSKEVLKMADAIVEIPMFGVNKSLNVMVSLGIVLYKVISKTIRG